MRTKYQTVFISQNEPEREFELTFELAPSKRIHVVMDVKVYDKRRDVFLELSYHQHNDGTLSAHCVSIVDYIQFDIAIVPTPEGASIAVIEKVLTTIYNNPNLQPCN